MIDVPKVLVISHNVFSNTNNMGKTLAEMFSFMPKGHLAQLYFHSEVPTLDLCDQYFRITDQDAMKGIIFRGRQGRILKKQKISPQSRSVRTDSGVIAKVYQYGRKRTPLIYWARDAMWRLSGWRSDQLERWIRSYSPDVIFFASGDYTFSYRIALDISYRYDIPIVLYCCDDYYLSERGKNLFLGRLRHKILMRWVHRVLERTTQIVVISDKMRCAYKNFMQAPIHTLRIPADINTRSRPASERKRIVYAGGLGVGRYGTLLSLGRELREAQIKGFAGIDVYTGERNPDILSKLTEENGIYYHGAVSASEIDEILGNAKYLLILESFDRDAVNRTRYSLSTKIGESLQSGACMIAYGPGDISSMEYLLENGCACMLSKSSDLPDVISKLESKQDLYADYIHHALQLASNNHDRKRNAKEMQSILIRAVS